MDERRKEVWREAKQKKRGNQKEEEDVLKKEKKPRQQQNMGRAINMHLARILRISQSINNPV